MALNRFVKINHVTNLSDARYCAGMMVDQLGFNFIQDTPTSISLDKFNEISGWVSGVDFVAEFGALSFDVVRPILDQFPFELIQTESLELASQLAERDTKVILEINDSNVEIISQLHDSIISNIAYLLVTTKLLDETKLSLLTSSYQIVKNTGNDLSEIKSLNEIWHGVALHAWPEDRPGFKDYGSLMDALEYLEEVD